MTMHSESEFTIGVSVTDCVRIKTFTY